MAHQFPDVTTDAFVVMPNHVHGILMLGTMTGIPHTTDPPDLSRVIQRFKGQSTNDYVRGVHECDWP
jgi:REP element-mobilizing transposase RayT